MIDVEKLRETVSRSRSENVAEAYDARGILKSMGPPLARAYLDLQAENRKLRGAVQAAGKIGAMLEFLGDDQDRIDAFLDALGPDLREKARAALAEGGEG